MEEEKKEKKEDIVVGVIPLPIPVDVSPYAYMVDEVSKEILKCLKSMPEDKREKIKSAIEKFYKEIVSIFNMNVNSIEMASVLALTITVASTNLYRSCRDERDELTCSAITASYMLSLANVATTLTEMFKDHGQSRATYVM